MNEDDARERLSVGAARCQDRFIGQPGVGGSVSQKVRVDDGQWPVLVVTQLVDQMTDEERLASLEECNRVLTAHGRDIYAMVLDNRRAGPLPATQRKLMAEYMEKHAMRARSRCVCTAFVSDSAVMRAMLTAIMWLRTPVVETRVFANLDEAAAWSGEMLRRKQSTWSSNASSP